MFSIPSVYFTLIQSGIFLVSYWLIEDNINYDLYLVSDYKQAGSQKTVPYFEWNQQISD